MLTAEEGAAGARDRAGSGWGSWVLSPCLGPPALHPRFPSAQPLLFPAGAGAAPRSRGAAKAKATASSSPSPPPPRSGRALPRGGARGRCAAAGAGRARGVPAAAAGVLGPGTHRGPALATAPRGSPAAGARPAVPGGRRSGAIPGSGCPGAAVAERPAAGCSTPRTAALRPVTGNGQLLFSHEI